MLPEGLVTFAVTDRDRRGDQCICDGMGWREAVGAVEPVEAALGWREAGPMEAASEWREAGFFMEGKAWR